MAKAPPIRWITAADRKWDADAVWKAFLQLLNGADVDELSQIQRIAFLAHHGVLVCGENVAYAFDDLYYLERSCMVQIIAMSSGRKLKHAPQHLVEQAARQIESERQQSALHFEALKRILDREQPGWSGHR